MWSYTLHDVLNSHQPQPAGIVLYLLLSSKEHNKYMVSVVLWVRGVSSAQSGSKRRYASKLLMTNHTPRCNFKTWCWCYGCVQEGFQWTCSCDTRFIALCIYYCICLHNTVCVLMSRPHFQNRLRLSVSLHDSSWHKTNKNLLNMHHNQTQSWIGPQTPPTE